MVRPREDTPVKRVSVLLAAAMVVGAFVVPGSAAAGDNGQLHRCQGAQGYFMSQATIDLPPGYWDEGEHVNSIHFLGWGVDETWGPWEWTVSNTAPLYPGQVVVAAGLFTVGFTPIPEQTINPAQDTVLWAGWAIGPGDYPTMAAANDELEDAAVLFSWDGGDERVAHQGPYASFCAGLWLSNFHRSFGPVAQP